MRFIFDSVISIAQLDLYVKRLYKIVSLVVCSKKGEMF